MMSESASSLDLDHLYEQLFLFYYNNCSEKNIDEFDYAVTRFFEALSPSEDKHNLSCLLVKYVATCVRNRDPVYGYGRRLQSYLMLLRLYDSYPQMAMDAIATILALPGGVTWEDVKYFSHYVWEETDNRRHPIITTLIDFAIENLQHRRMRKWVPREGGGRYAWIFHAIRKRYTMSNGGTPTPRAFRKLLGHFRDEITCGNAGPWKMERPGKLLRLMLAVKDPNENPEYVKELERRWSLIPRRTHDTYAIVDLSDASPSDMYDVFALAAVLSHDVKRIFVTAAVEHWINVESCTGLADYANMVRNVLNNLGVTVGNVGICVRAMEYACNECLQQGVVGPVVPPNIVVLFANDKYTRKHTSEIMDCWADASSRPRFCFWNLCQTHYYDQLPCKLIPACKHDCVTLVSGPLEISSKSVANNRSNISHIRAI